MITSTLEYFASEKLRDGRTLIIRALRRDDKDILQEGMHHLSKRSRYYRFLTPKDELTPAELDYFTDVDLFHHVALLALLLEDGREIPIGVGRYVGSTEPE